MDRKKVYENFCYFIRHTIIWWLLIGGLFLLICSNFEIFGSSPKLNGFLKSIGSAIFVGGIFSVILKSLQLMGIFNEELVKVIYDTKFLYIRRDIREIWKNVSKVLYESKFPEISDRIENTIFETYFPTKSDYYYDTYQENIVIEFCDEAKEFIEVIEDIGFIIKATDKSQKIFYGYSTIIDRFKGDTTADFDLLELIINDLDWKEKCNITIDKQNNKFVKVNYNVELIGCKEYNIKRKVKKIYSIVSNQTKGFRTKRLVNNLELHITFPAELNVTFYPTGTIEEYIDRAKDAKNLIWREYNGLLFPKQGYRLIFQRR